MRILGLDTATRRASVGVWCDGQIVAEESIGSNRNHAVTLLPLIDDTLRQAGCSIRDVEAVAVSSGPGSFSGLRVGLSVAKGLVCATGARIIAVPTLEALARTVDGPQEAICTLLDAYKGELYAAVFAPAARGWSRLTPDTLLTPEGLRGWLPLPCTVVGDTGAPYGDLLREQFGSAITILPFETYGPRGGVVAALGWQRLQAGESADATHLEPFYIRPSHAASIST